MIERCGTAVWRVVRFIVSTVSRIFSVRRATRHRALAEENPPGDQAPGTATDRFRPPVSLGVLFVHGIGDQARGDTLVQSAEPLYRWLERWIEEAQPGHPLHGHTVAVSDVLLRRAGTRPQDPAHLTLRVVPPQPGPDQFVGDPISTPPPPPDVTAWVLAEGWWAADFAPPSFFDVVKWGLGIGPWMLLRHATLELKELPRQRPMARPATLLHVAMAFVGGAVIQAVMLILLVLAVVPPLRGFVAALQARLSGTFGDPYVLAASPIRFGAMVSQVQRDLRWLRDHGCGPIAVVAHSQGTAIAHAALWSERDPPVGLFVTYGSAISKLHLLRSVLGRGARLFVGGILSTAGIAVLTASLVLLWLYGRDPLLFLPTAVGIGLYLAGIFVPVTGASELHARDLRLPELAARGVSRWFDYFATADPVPDGALPFPDRPGFRSRSIRNRDSLLRDHTTYWENREEFVPRVARLLTWCSGWELLAPGHRSPPGAPPSHADGPTIAAARIKRDARVDAVSWSSVISTFSVIASSFGLGASGLAAASGPVRRVVTAAAELLPLPFEGPIGRATDGDATEVVLGLAVVAAAAGLWHAGVVIPAWRGWERAEIDALFARQTARRTRSWEAGLFPFATVAPPVAAGFSVLLGRGGLSLVDRGASPSILWQATAVAWLLVVLAVTIPYLVVLARRRRRWPA